MKPFRKSQAVLATLLVAFVTSMLVSGCTFLPAEEETLQPPLKQPQTVEYKTVPVERGDLVDQLRLTGKFYPELSMSLSFENQGGRLKSIDVGYAAEVKAGDLIAQLDSGSLTTDIKLLELDMEKTQLTISQLRKNGADYYSIRRAQIDLEQQQIRLDNYNAQLEQTMIRSPIDGRITYLISTSIGDYISAFQTVAVVADISKLAVITGSSGTSELPIGGIVTVDYEKQTVAGEVIANPSTLYNDPNQSLRNSAIIRLDEMPEGARLGSPARITYIRDESDNVLIVARSSVYIVGGRRYVNVLEDGIRVERDVSVGLVTDTQVEIVSGLDEGDLVITN